MDLSQIIFFLCNDRNWCPCWNELHGSELHVVSLSLNRYVTYLGREGYIYTKVPIRSPFSPDCRL